MNLLSIDPSSTRTGWAVFHGEDLFDSGTIGPRASLTSWERIMAIANSVGDLLVHKNIEYVVMEVGRKTHAGKPNVSGLQVYGMAMGAIGITVASFFHAVSPSDKCYEFIDANQWVRGLSKPDRIRNLGIILKDYPRIKEICAAAGGDEGDAVDMGMWWLDEQRLRVAVERQYAR